MRDLVIVWQPWMSWVGSGLMLGLVLLSARREWRLYRRFGIQGPSRG